MHFIGHYVSVLRRGGCYFLGGSGGGAGPVELFPILV